MPDPKGQRYDVENGRQKYATELREWHNQVQELFEFYRCDKGATEPKYQQKIKISKQAIQKYDLLSIGTIIDQCRRELNILDKETVTWPDVHKHVSDFSKVCPSCGRLSKVSDMVPLRADQGHHRQHPGSKGV